MHKTLVLLLLFPTYCFAQESNNITSIYPKMIGDIEFDPHTDSEDFEICYPKHVQQYFSHKNGLEYEGEKLAILKAFQ
ncbi:MAG: hypothetical protein ACRCVT_02115 [Leadbetterella sp.]